MERFEHGGNVYKGEKILLDFSINVSPFGTPPKVKETIISQIDGFDIYPDPNCTALRKALSDYHGLEKEKILCGNGASDLIFRICAWKKAKIALTLAPSFSEYERGVRQFGGEIREYVLTPENGFLLTEDFLTALTPDVDMVFLCNPNNPTGRTIPGALLQEIIAACKERRITLVLDECFISFTRKGSMQGLLHDNFLILRAFTKMYGMAGIRLGYLLGEVNTLKEIAAYGSEWSVSTVAQVAGIGALSQENWEEQTRCMVEQERAYVTEKMEKLGLSVIPGEGNFLLVQGTAGIWEKLKQKGILIRRCENFTGLGDDYFRIGLKLRKENDILLTALEEVLHGESDHDSGNHVQCR